MGRTGSGKTTFVSALWRLVEPTRGEQGVGGGAIEIDGVDIGTMQLHALRSRLAIIVQVRQSHDPRMPATHEAQLTSLASHDLAPLAMTCAA